MGSQSKINLAYIAGFLDGDGSLMLQIKKRKDSKLKRRFMCTICFYQDSRHEKSLYWIRKILGIGYISRRNDGMTELRINGFKQIKDILKDLLPFIRFKKEQAKALYNAADLLNQKESRLLNKNDLLKLADHIITIQKNNYVTRKKKTKADILKILGLTP
ncbi:MAG: Homing endonuclease [Candidatus Daviesbacteria bacterium GW2011_GWB1_41_5]|uniref:Homing endonuclease n=1 Tax=Candidatus Daviesbacteria bacterium GW2011_GWB1_41_5 TaxID=1618429 RepID=A0A0G0WE65_9BACT|nr:MAG: Homing endonuclease [Candidatus Daviesbacteria bacterium GW2011_GWB1_41_5]